MDIKAITKDVASTAITKFFHKREVKTVHVLDKIFPKQRRIRSLIGGLETSFGIKMWETLAKIFAEKNGFEILNEKEFNKNQVPLKIPSELYACLDKWKHQREEYEGIALDGYLEELKELIHNTDLTHISYGKMPKGEGLDVWIRKDNSEFLFDIKTNQINAGGGPKYNELIMRWYLYRLINNADIDIKCQIAFPFNPYPTDFWATTKDKATPLIPSQDALVENEFWDFLSGQKGTWDQMMLGFDELRDEGFGAQFEDIFELIEE